MTLKMVKLSQLLIYVTFCIALLVSTASCQLIPQESSSSPIVQTLSNDQLNCPSFDQYVIKYQKGYVKGTLQYENRQRIYNQRVQQLRRKLNDPQITYKIGCNQFSDESQQQRTERKPLLVDQNQRKVASQQPHKLEQVSGKPSSLDWRQKNIITSIKDQGKCGACWTFATNAYGQSRMLLKNLTQDRDINLSEQYLLSCTPQCSCEGGYLEYVFQKAAGGVPLQNDYPYSPFFPSNPFICWTGQKQYFGYIPKKLYDLSGSQLEDLLQTSPVAISVSATNWEDYSGGVFRCRPFDKVNHAVLLVGYTPDYWIIKNQWATKWGQNGFIRVDRSSLYNCKIGTSAFVMWESHSILALCLIAISFFAL